MVDFACRWAHVSFRSKKMMGQGEIYFKVPHIQIWSQRITDRLLSTWTQMLSFVDLLLQLPVLSPPLQARGISCLTITGRLQVIPAIHQAVPCTSKRLLPRYDPPSDDSKASCASMGPRLGLETQDFDPSLSEGNNYNFPHMRPILQLHKHGEQAPTHAGGV